MNLDAEVVNCGSQEIPMAFEVGYFVGAGVPKEEFVQAAAAAVPAGMPALGAIHVHIEVPWEEVEQLPHYEHPYSGFDRFWRVDTQDIIQNCTEETEIVLDEGPMYDY